MKQQLLDALAPILDFLGTLNPGDANAAETLNEKFPIAGQEMTSLAELLATGVEEGWLCDRAGGPGVSFSRVTKAANPDEFSIDAVRMDRPGPGHTHPNGEFDLCFAVDGEPAFDGHNAGWVVYPPGSWHVPTVTKGTMNILYFLPGGAIDFGPKPTS